MPNPKKLLATLDKATRAFLETPGRRGAVVHLQDADEVLVAGDLHGNVAHFAGYLKKADLQRQPRRHLVVQELIHGSFRYPAGGDRSHQLLDLLAALKCQFPRQVHFLLGNHELAQWKDRRIGKGNDSYNELFQQGIRTAYGAFADRIYDAYLRLFAASSLVVRTANRVFISHSLPPEAALARFDLATLEEEDWCQQEAGPGSAIYALVWGRDTRESTAAAFLRKVDADFLVTGHIPSERGYDFPNPFQLVLDGMNEVACYCLFSTETAMGLEVMKNAVGRLDGPLTEFPGTGERPGD
jgi:hypothetical protein